ncbi:hypothetical protein V6N13_030151 [Hibiscus sabdariffa]
MDRVEIWMQNQEGVLKSLENQVGQISQVLNTKLMGGFSIDTEVVKGATHEQCKALSTRSGKILNTYTKNKLGEETVAIPNTVAVQDKPAQA